MRFAIAVLLLGVGTLWFSCRTLKTPTADSGVSDAVSLGSGERLLTILGTNDIHGSMEASPGDGNKPVGGMTYWSGVVQAIRAGAIASYGDNAGVLLLDAGDQFQGTLVSNFNEGKAMMSIMSLIGYDAIVPGNHDYDFGPLGWQDDVVLETTESALRDNVGALKAALQEAQFPVLSANTYLRASLKAAGSGEPVEVESENCRPETEGLNIDWAAALRPSFVKPYAIIAKAGLKVAVIAVDNEDTAKTSMPPNLVDFCFRDFVESYREVRAALQGQADVFVMLAHEGDLDDMGFKEKIRRLLQDDPDAVDAVVSGHSHRPMNYQVDGVPVIQSAANGTKFGRIDLVFDVASGRVNKAKTRLFGGAELAHHKCASVAAATCRMVDGVPQYDGHPVVPMPAVKERVEAARHAVQEIASRVVGSADGEVTRSRKSDSPLANGMTDTLRLATGADVTFINSATLRTTMPKGELTYDHLFQVLPFANRTIRLKPLSTTQIVKLAQRTVSESGEYGVLNQSGLKITYMGSGSNAKVLRVQTAAGELIYDRDNGGNQTNRSFTVVTLSYLTDPLSGVSGLNDVPRDADLGVFREIVANHLFASPRAFSTSLDDRLVKL